MMYLIQSYMDDVYHDMEGGAVNAPYSDAIGITILSIIAFFFLSRLVLNVYDKIRKRRRK